MSDLNLLKKFMPRVFIHPDEQYFPSKVETFINNSCDLEYEKDGVLGSDFVNITDQPTTTNINLQTYQGDSSSYKDSGNKKKPFILVLKNNSYRSGSGAGSVNDIPFYGMVNRQSDVCTDLLYCFFYSYNGASMNSPGDGYFTHEGDWEHIVVRLNQSQDTILGVYAQAHRVGDPYSHWYYPPGIGCPPQDEDGAPTLGDTRQFEWADEGTTVRIYASLSGHASYVKEGDWWYGLRGRDKASGDGTKWVPNGITVMTGAEPWNDFNGRFGQDGGPHSPLVQGWLNKLKKGGPCYPIQVTKDKVVFGNRYSQNFKLDYANSVKWIITCSNASVDQDTLNSVNFSLSRDFSGLPDSTVLLGIKNGAVTPGQFCYATDANLYVGTITYGDKSGNEVLDCLKVSEFTLTPVPV